MEKFTKITVGFVVQTFEKNKKSRFVCTGQEFIAGDDVQFKDAEGEPLEAPEHEYQPFNMTLVSKDEIIEQLRAILASIDVGGEQSRQFVDEIAILDKLLRDLGWISQD